MRATFVVCTCVCRRRETQILLLMVICSPCSQFLASRVIGLCNLLCFCRPQHPSQSSWDDVRTFICNTEKCWTLLEGFLSLFASSGCFQNQFISVKVIGMLSITQYFFLIALPGNYDWLRINSSNSLGGFGARKGAEFKTYLVNRSELFLSFWK